MTDNNEFSNPVEMGPVFRQEFEKLRHMETFSDAMFNRIVGFQEREHKAWDASLPFSDRIKDLALHALIFSNPDRDAAVNAHTVAPFYPLQSEMQQIAHCIKQLGDEPRVCDVHANNGFIGSLLAREGVNVTGLRQPEIKPNQIADFYDDSCYQLKEGEISDIDFDVAFSCWMPSGENQTPDILLKKPKMIIFMHTDHADETGKQFQTGTPDAFVDLPDNYALIAEWTITRPKDLMHEIWPELTASIEETRHVKIYADTPYHDIDIRGEIKTDPDLYDWEQDLSMALTALQAKEVLRSQGFPV